MSDPKECWHEAHPWCPYCGHPLTDLFEYGLDDEQSAEIECGECDKTFRITMHVRVTYTATPEAPHADR